MQGESGTIERTQPPPVDLFAGVRNVCSFAMRRRGWFVGGLLAGILLALVVRFLLPSKSEVHAKILVIKKDASLPAEGFEGGRDFEGHVVEDLLSTHMEILTSPKVVDLALTARKLDGLPSISAVLKPDQTPVEYVIENLSVSRGGEGQAKTAHVLNVTFVHRDAGDAARILDAVVDTYRSFVDQTFKDVGSEAATLISQTSNELADDLKKKQAARRQHREQSPLLWSGEESFNIHQTRINEFESELARLSTRQARIESRLQVIQDRLKDSSPLIDVERLSLIADEDMQRFSLLTSVEGGSSLTKEFQASQPARSQIATVEFERLATLRTEEQALRTEFGPNHRGVREKRLAIDELEKLLKQNAPRLSSEVKAPVIEQSDLLNAYVSLLKQDLVEVQSRQRVLNALVATEVSDAKKLVVYELEDEALHSEITGTMSMYTAVADRLKEINLVKDYGGFVTEVLAPVEPGLPMKASLLVTIAAGALLGLMFGGAGALVVDSGDQSFRGPGEISSLLNLPILAHVPGVDSKTTRAYQADGAEASFDSSVWSALRPGSREAEAFRALRTDLCFGEEGGDNKVFQITSANPGDGKSLVAANLAVSLAQSGKTVLLVDCDLRRPAVHQLFKLGAQQGLSNVLAGETDLPDAVQSTGIAGLFILPSGPLPSNPAERLASTKFDQMLELVSNRYDFVLLDSAPLLAVSDPAVIAARADVVLLVLRLAKRARSSAVLAQQKLAAVGADVAGVVVNCVDKRSCRYYGRSGEDHSDFGISDYDRFYEYAADPELAKA